MAIPPKSHRVPKSESTRVTKCITYPNRTSPRPFTAEKIAAIICKWVETAQLEEQQRLRQLLSQGFSPCFECFQQQTETRGPEFAFTQMRLAIQQVLTENKTVIAVALAVLLALVVIPRVFAFLPASALVLLPFGARVAITQIPGIIARLRAAQAANDSAFKLVAGL